jgi:uncharacterized RDD family membrane protein YckC
MLPNGESNACCNTAGQHGNGGHRLLTLEPRREDAMDSFYEIAYLILNWTYTLLVLVAFVWACTWRGGRGKALLCVFLLLTLTTRIAWQVLSLLVNRRVLLVSSPASIEAINLAIFMVFVLAGVLLLCFVIVARGAAQNQPVAASSWRTPASLTARDRASILQRREWTYLIDALIINVASYGIVIGSAVIIASQRDEELATYLLGTLCIVCPALLFMLKDSFAGKSLGKLMTGLTVINMDTGRPIGPITSMLRNLLFLLPFFPLVELIVANVRQDKRRLGDLMANTIVVKDAMLVPAAIVAPVYRVSLPTEPAAVSHEPTAHAEPPGDLQTPVAAVPEPLEQQIHLTCACGAKIKVSSRYAGRSGKCPRCKAALTIPPAAP